MRETVKEYGYAKINLFLEVLSKRDDGYHEIDSIMQTVSLADRISVTVSDGDGISLTCSDSSLPCDERNIAFKAALLYNETYGIKASTACNIEKVIPIAAGLAGGSADAAAVLIALERIHGCAKSQNELCRLAKKLGADVPFCVMGGIARTRGIGEVLSECAEMPHCHIVIACGKERMSTAAAYAKIDTLSGRSFVSADIVAAALEAGNLSEICGGMYNIFERVTEYPAVIKEILLSCGAKAAMMSGSGPAVFGIFAEAENALEARDKLIAAGCDAYAAEPVKRKNIPFSID